jgi:thioredoxin-related protein
MRLRLRFSLFFLVISLLKLGAQEHAPGGAEEPGLVKWLTFKEAIELNKKQPKPFLVDIYTDWCGWCKHMMKTTYSDPGIANYINTYFYPIKFDAETKDSIEYNGAWYFNRSKEKKSVHELAIKMLGTSLSYPSTIFVSNNFQFNLLTQGYLEVRKIEPILIYTVENVYRSTTYDDFKINFEKTFYDTTKTKPVVKVYSMAEALELQAKQPKKIAVAIGISYCNSCKVMNATCFKDSALVKYMNDHFYLVHFDAESNEPVTLKGTVYNNTKSAKFPFHSLTLQLTRNNFILPSLSILSEDLDVIDCVPYYLTDKNLLQIIPYFGDNYYRKMKWDDYLKMKNFKVPIK